MVYQLYDRLVLLRCLSCFPNSQSKSFNFFIFQEPYTSKSEIKKLHKKVEEFVKNSLKNSIGKLNGSRITWVPDLKLLICIYEHCFVSLNLYCIYYDINVL